MPAKKRLKVGQVVRLNFEAQSDWPDEEGWTRLPKGSIGIVSDRCKRDVSGDYAEVYFSAIDKTINVEEIGLTPILEKSRK